MTDPARRFADALPNLPFPTLGGKQLWGDEAVVGGWRVQTNVVTGHARLLDRNDIRRAWGSRDHCMERLHREAPGGAEEKPLAVLLHGLGRAKESLHRLARALDAAGFEVVSVNYPSLREGIAAHAARVGRILDGIAGERRVTFVTHSLGALVVRHLLSRPHDWDGRLRVRDIVMIAPPNRGSSLAERLRRHRAFRLVAGPSGVAAAAGNIGRVPPIAIPCFVIAGGSRSGRGYNPFLDGDDDGIVAVAETRAGREDTTLRIEGFHTFISNDPRTVDAVVQYLCRHERRTFE